MANLMVGSQGADSQKVPQALNSRLGTHIVIDGVFAEQPPARCGSSSSESTSQATGSLET